MKRSSSIYFLSVILLLGLFTLAVSGDKTATRRTVTGQLTCIDCALSMKGDARGQCQTYGHEAGLVAQDGKIYTFVRNDRSRQLREHGTYTGKTVTVKGTIFTKANRIDVESFTVAGQKMEWCSKCSAMGPDHQHK